MNCPFCRAAETRVVDSRARASGFSIRRRRECVACGNRFTTYEQMAENPVLVVKKDATRVPFDRSKIRAGIEKAIYKRPIGSDDIENLISNVESEILRLGEAEVTSQRIGELVMKSLRELDQVAYVRFASVYRDFKDVSDFQAEIRPMLAESAGGTKKPSS